MATDRDLVTRDFTATTFVVYGDRTLLLWHNKMQAWLPPGGHLLQNELPETGARREVLEETGLEVALAGEPEGHWGTVTVLRTPICILLEDIGPGHQHIDLIYFATARTDAARVNGAEAARHRWFSRDELDSSEVAEDIRVLGQRAIAALGG